MADFIDTWSDDHKHFAHLLDLLESQIGFFLEDKTPKYDLILDIMYYMTHYPDIFHHPKEDLVSARLKELDAGAAVVVNELTGQHAVLRESGTKLLELLQRVVDGVMLKRENIEQPARTYIAYFRLHMAKEEANIFPAMRALLSTDDWAAIEKAAPFKEDPLFGNGALEQRYEALHRQIMRESDFEAAA